MKAIQLHIFISLLGAAILLRPQKSAAQDVVITCQAFYDELSPYGDWVLYEPYGYVWVPSAGPHFAPYCSNGYWMWTEYGWCWMSYYPWGWAPFHYGRWDYVPHYGWVWVPGYEWGPAWVIWAHSPGCYGWVPMGPGMTVGIMLEHHYHTSPKRWVFVNEGYMGRDDIYRYYGARRGNRSQIKNASVIDRTYKDKSRGSTYVMGPGRDEVERASGKIIAPVRVEDNTRPGQNLNHNRMEVYRPRVEQAGQGGAKPAPARISGRSDVPPPRNRPDKTETPMRVPAPSNNPNLPRQAPNNDPPAHRPERAPWPRIPVKPNERPNTQPGQPRPNEQPRQRDQPGNAPRQAPQPPRTIPRQPPVNVPRPNPSPRPPVNRPR